MHAPLHPPVRYNIGGSALSPEDAERFRTGGAVPCCCDAEGKYDGSIDEAQTNYLLRARWVLRGCRVLLLQRVQGLESHAAHKHHVDKKESEESASSRVNHLPTQESNTPNP